MSTVSSYLGQSERNEYPETVVLDGVRLAETKALLQHGDPRLKITLGHLIAQAERWLKKGPWTVTSKETVPPSGDKHDYASQAPYWWPSPTADGSPYIQRDGVKNPEVYNYTDRKDCGNVFESSYILSLSWYYTGNEAYAKHAGKILRTWFISADSRMNPNLNHAQIIPHANTGRAIGIIDFSQGYTNVLDAAAILAVGAPGWTKSDMKGFHEWNVDFLYWLENSEFGAKESKENNNHGTFAMMQKAAIALFVGDKAVAERELLLMQCRINDYISPDGSQPLELKRTRSWHYSIFNLVAYSRMAAIGKKFDVDLWRYKGLQGQSINAAVDFIIPSAIGSVAWEFPELDFNAFAASDIVHAAADAGNPRAKEAVSMLQTPPRADLWALRPAAEQLGLVKG